MAISGHLRRSSAGYDNGAVSRTWREIGRCDSPQDAEALRALLAGHGVDAIIPDLHILGVQPMCNKGASAVRVLVPQDHAERACAILKSLRDDRRDAPRADRRQ